MREVNRKVLGLAVTLLLAAMFVVPALAAPATKIEGVTLTAAVTQVPTSGPRFVDHTILHTKGTSTGTVTLTIPEQDPLDGVWDGEWIGRNKWSNYPDPDPEAELIIMGKVVLTFEGKGTFEGTSHRTIIGWPASPSSYFEDHMVLQGTGDFKGQALKLSYEGAPPVVFEGYLIIPN